jgi:hypothetical protein
MRSVSTAGTHRIPAVLYVMSGLISGAAVTVALYYRQRFGEDEFLGPLFPGVVVSVLGLILVVVSYLWLFEAPHTCMGRDDFPCMINSNQGFLTLLGLLIAVVALWTGIVANAVGRRREGQEAEARTRTAVCDAIDELHHNLQHIAGSYRGNQIRLVPQITVDSTLALLEPANRLQLSSAVIKAIEPLRRNAERLKELRAATRDPNGPPPSTADPEPIGGFFRCSLEVLIFFWRHHHAWSCNALQRPGLQDLPRFAPNRALITYRSSEAISDAPWLRTEEAPLVCWLDDQPIPGVKAYAVGQRFVDAEEAHSDH